MKLSTAEKIILSFMLFIAGLLVLRIGYANNTRYIFLLWNLFLAWVPFQLSVALTRKAFATKWYRYLILGSWLLFFPNALYIITDLIHLENLRDIVPVWFDAILLFASSVTGLIMAFVSLYQVEIFLGRNLRKKQVNQLIIGALFLGSFGVYVGRFLRWNSWDIVTNPVALTTQLTTHITMPFEHYRTWIITLLLTGLFSLLYFSLKQLPGVVKQSR